MHNRDMQLNVEIYQNQSISLNMFSVIIPLFNKEQYIIKAIDSVLNQTYQGFELIIIDDGSTDDSLEKVSLRNESRIRIFNQVNPVYQPPGITE